VSYVRWNITLPEPLANRIEVILHDEILGKPGYGARSNLIEQLLSQWLALHIKHKERNDGWIGSFIAPLSRGSLNIVAYPDHVKMIRDATQKDAFERSVPYTPSDIMILRNALEIALRTVHQYQLAFNS
jgi:hypothetical protein